LLGAFVIAVALLLASALMNLQLDREREELRDRLLSFSTIGEEEISHLREQLDDMQQRLGESQASLKRSQQEVASLQSATNTLALRVTELDAELQKKEASLLQRLLDATTQAKELKESNTTLRRQVTAYSNEIARLKAALTPDPGKDSTQEGQQETGGDK